MIRISKALALVAALALAACYPPVTSHPIGTTAGLKQDPALEGTWKGMDLQGKPGYAHFLARDNGAATMVVLVPAHGSGDADVVIAVVTSVRFGSFGYLNARLAQANGEDLKDQPPGTVPVLYRIDAKGTMTLALMDETAAKAAIAAGRIRGTVEQGSMGDATITADPKALDAFFASPAAVALFAKPFFTLHKVD